MYTHKYYMAVTSAKEVVGKYIEEHDDLLDAISSGEMSYILRSRKVDDRITARAAVAAVLTSGTFLESGQFMTPSTELCLMNFKYTRRQLSDNRPIEVSVADSNHDVYTIRM